MTKVNIRVITSPNFIDLFCFYPCENEVGFIGTVLELSGTHFNGTFWDNHLIPINPNIGIIWY